MPFLQVNFRAYSGRQPICASARYKIQQALAAQGLQGLREYTNSSKLLS